MTDRPVLWPLILAGVFVFFMWNLTSLFSENPHKRVEFEFDRESLTVMRSGRIGVILKSKEDGEVDALRFDAEDVSFVASERKAGTAAVECLVSADTGKVLIYGSKITLYVSPDDLMARSLYADALEDGAVSSTGETAATHDGGTSRPSV